MPHIQTAHHGQKTHSSSRRAESQVNETANAIVQMLSETAHDLRSPLTTIRESIRLVHDGDLGPIQHEQQACLSAAIDQCDCIDQMVGEMVQLERLQSGIPRAQRGWVSVSEVRTAVEETLRPWTLPRNIDVLWDGAEDAKLLVFADPAILRRMIVNLVVNAIRATPENESVLVRLQKTPGGEAICWSVIDQGVGITPAQMKRIESQQFSSSSGEGLGLAICRQLAALHFSTLRLRSRTGYGTDASFLTPVGGPKSVAECWVRWRKRVSDGETETKQHQSDPSSENLRSKIQRRVRLDPPLLSVELMHNGASPRQPESFALGTVSLGAAMARDAADDFDRVLQTHQRLFDFAYRVDTRRWVWVFDADSTSVIGRIQSITEAAQAALRGIRLQWGKTNQITLDHRATTAKLSDLLIRETLAAHAPSTIADANQVRLGTKPIEPSTTATERLELELRRLSGRFQRESATLKRQAEALRPDRGV
ncbi:sensor histidine kinase [Novipirellula artificiosorum]|uniref:histidine kinase n=1 Tax=Novipirellula artificiosorum TaxID=2528016 RepID=A0A5C6DC84_9BACT|nr:HAMP domain-containing sensor histidine kinase [Novipirellula artificiosorum]TWU33321.1 Non-motile and phage-resistance protein [Novipirellula artificiosorum]